MPLYPFQWTDSGETFEHYFPMAEAPSIGATVTLYGKRARRLPSGAQVSASVATVTHKYPYVSSSLPRNLAGAETTSTGKPIVTSRRHERELMARHNLTRD
jgi:hypothetical protein